MEYTRLLKRGRSGADVRYMKDALVTLGYLARATHDRFGDDTFAAVKAYQRANRDTSGRPLTVDGIIGRKTWDAIVRDITAQETEPPADISEIPSNIGQAAKEAIARSLLGVSETRRNIVLLGLRFAYDPTVPRDYPYSLYIRGGNLYNTDLSPNIIDAARIESGARRQPQYYDGGSKEMMLEAVAAYPDTTGADCSGGIVGLLRKLALVSPTFDKTADSLLGSSHSSAIDKNALRSGDFLGRPGHIGLYAGGGYGIEWAGKRYGCQLTRVDDRRVYDFVSKSTRRLSAWTKFRDPKYY